MITHPAPDHIYKNREYRLAEPGRAQGSSVRYGAPKVWCNRCPRLLRPSVKAVRLPDHTWLCISCAVASRVLVALERVP